MSRTDKDRPDWVRIQDAGTRIEHDHRSGRCEISDDRRDRWGGWRHHSYERCKKYTRVDFTCTKADPFVEPGWRWRLEGRRCWRSFYERVEPDNPYSEFRWVSVQCVGHHRWERDDDVACSCDDKPTATCFPEYPHYWNPYIGPGGVPSSFVSLYYHRPERQKVRAGLADARRRFNAGEDLEDEDLEVTDQARNSARWLYW